MHRFLHCAAQAEKQSLAVKITSGQRKDVHAMGANAEWQSSVVRAAVWVWQWLPQAGSRHERWVLGFRVLLLRGGRGPEERESEKEERNMTRYL
jgi:hypothetical protein